MKRKAFSIFIHLLLICTIMYKLFIHLPIITIRNVLVINVLRKSKMFAVMRKALLQKKMKNLEKMKPLTKTTKRSCDVEMKMIDL